MIEHSEAQEHLAMVDRIVDRSSTRLQVGGEYFIVWGIASGLVMLLAQLISTGALPVAAMWAWPLFIGSGVVFSIWRGRSYGLGGRHSLLEVEFLNVLRVALMVAFLVELVGFHIFTDAAALAIWSVASSIVLFFIGMHGNQRARLGGIILIASIAAANFFPAFAGYALAGGMFIGYAGFGCVEMLAASRARD